MGKRKDKRKRKQRMATSQVTYKDSPFINSKTIGPTVATISRMSEPIAKAVLKIMVEKLDDEDAQGTFGEKGWRHYFLGSAEEDNPITTEDASANTNQASQG